jgi:hypothetical protein
MDNSIAKEVISVIRTERQRRADRLKEEDPDVAYDQWLFTDEPFINEMCLMVLVALRHQVERQLVFIAARADTGRASMSVKEYQQNVTNERERLKQRSGWRALEAKLNLGSFSEWGRSLKTLHLLANCFKHEPWQEPDEGLLKHLGLPAVKQLKPPIVRYMPFPESGCFKEGLAASVNLSKDVGYCEIAERFIDLADQFLEDVQRATSQARVAGRVSLVEFGC